MLNAFLVYLLLSRRRLWVELKIVAKIWFFTETTKKIAEKRQLFIEKMYFCIKKRMKINRTRLYFGSGL